MQELALKRMNQARDALAALTAVVVIGYLLGLFFVSMMLMFCIFLISFYVLEYTPDFFAPDLTVNRKILSFVCMIAGIVPYIYLIPHIPRIGIFYGAIFTTADVVFGTIAVISAMIWVYRRFGLGMPIIAGIFCLYVIFGHLLPRELMGIGQQRYGRFISFLFSESAMLGPLMSIAFRVIFVYMLFGAFLNASGVGNYMIKVALFLAGKYRGGPAKVAVISSMLIGTVTGSAIANVATTGPVTIPMMKKSGYQPHFAGAVEAISSTGGQILPPVMGAGAFIMAELMGVPFSTVAIAAILPALLFFTGILLQVDLEACRRGLKGASPEDLPNGKEVFKQLHMFLPIIGLIYMLLIARFSVTRAGLIAIVLTVITSWTTKDFKLGPRKIYKALVNGTYDSIGVTAICLLAGVITGAVTSSGFATQFSSFVISFAGGSLFGIAFFTALICFIIGLGLPTSAAYVVTVAIALPALTRTGVEPIAAHMFIFYYAILANVSPPVAPAAFAGATIAEAHPLRTCVEAVRLGSIAYIVPFLFINDTTFLSQGTILNTAQAFTMGLFGCVMFSMILQGITFSGKSITWLVRLIWAGALFGIFHPSDTGYIGIILFMIGFFLYFIINRIKNNARILENS